MIHYDIQEEGEDFLSKTFPEVALSSAQGQDILKIWWAAHLSLALRWELEVSEEDIMQFLHSIRTQIDGFIQQVRNGPR